MGSFSLKSCGPLPWEKNNSEFKMLEDKHWLSVGEFDGFKYMLIFGFVFLGFWAGLNHFLEFLMDLITLGYVFAM